MCALLFVSHGSEKNYIGILIDQIDLVVKAIGKYRAKEFIYYRNLRCSNDILEVEYIDADIVRSDSLQNSSHR